MAPELGQQHARWDLPETGDTVSTSGDKQSRILAELQTGLTVAPALDARHPLPRPTGFARGAGRLAALSLRQASNGAAAATHRLKMPLGRDGERSPYLSEIFTTRSAGCRSEVWLSSLSSPRPSLRQAPCVPSRVRRGASQASQDP